MLTSADLAGYLTADRENLGTRLSCFGSLEQNGGTVTEHFTRFTANYCLNASQEQQEDNSMDNICYLEYISRPEQTLI